MAMAMPNRALIVTNKGKGQNKLQTCSNCGLVGHSTTTCWCPGGGMEGRCEEIMAGQVKRPCQANIKLDNGGKGEKYQKAAPTTMISQAQLMPFSLSSHTASVWINGRGRAYILSSEGETVYLSTKHDSPSPSPSLTPPKHFMGILVTDESDDKAFLAMTTDCLSMYVSNDLFATVDWAKLHYTTDFVMDSGASTHVSGDVGDFTNLQSIPPQTVHGIGKSAIEAVGIGDIHLTLVNKTSLLLWQVLYIPSTQVQLISVKMLC
jgi:hypothetical protein